MCRGLGKVQRMLGRRLIKCMPNTPNPWEFVNEDSIVEGAPALMVCSTLTCRYGGVIEIIDPSGEGSIDVGNDGPDDKPNINPEGWDEISEMFPNLEADIQKVLQSAGDIVGVKSSTSHEYSITLPDGTSITLTTSFGIAANAFGQFSFSTESWPGYGSPCIYSIKHFKCQETY